MLKCGPHAILNTAAACQWAAVAPITKALNTEVLRAAKPGAIQVYRHYFPDPQPLDDAVGTVNQILAGLGDYRATNLYVELWNETHPTLAQLRAATDLLHAHGLKVAGGSYGTGDYTALDWEIVTQAGCDAYAVHCYWDPGELTIYEAFRYRMFWQPGDKPVLITECGRRHGQNTVTELVAYANQITSDSYVLGATPFSSGATPDWIDQGFDIDAITPDLMAALGGNVPTPTPPSSNALTLGVDVSNNNGAIDIPLLARCVQYAIFKASEGTDFRDDTFGPNWYAAGVANLCRGAYHFARPSANSGNAEALFFLDQLTRNGFNSGNFLALDLEDDRVAPDADLLAYTLDFLRTIYGALGVRPLLYSRTQYLSAHNCLGNAELGQYGLWLADWQTEAFPATPPGWPFVAMWQYGLGDIPGVKKMVDMDYFNGPLDALKRYGKP